MSAITLDLPDDLAERLRALADRLPRILELGLRELDASSQSGFAGASGLSPAEEEEWQRYEYLEHLVRLAKAKAAVKLELTESGIVPLTPTGRATVRLLGLNQPRRVEERVLLIAAGVLQAPV